MNYYRLFNNVLNDIKRIEYSCDGDTSLRKIPTELCKSRLIDNNTHYRTCYELTRPELKDSISYDILADVLDMRSNRYESKRFAANWLPYYGLHGACLRRYENIDPKTFAWSNYIRYEFPPSYGVVIRCGCEATDCTYGNNSTFEFYITLHNGYVEYYIPFDIIYDAYTEYKNTSCINNAPEDQDQ